MGVPILSRVVWREGMLLAQHHFQAQSRYFESAIHFAVSSVFGAPYGFLSIELDDDALWNGTAVLLRASGVMPDGLAFDFGEDESPSGLPVRDGFRAGAEGETLHLAIPSFRRRQPNLAVDEDRENGAALRYRLEEVELFDETTGDDRRRIPLGLTNFRLVLASQIPEGWVSMPLALVRPDGNGHFVADPDFIPPCLQIGASPSLLGLLRRLVEMMEAKAAAVVHGASPGGSDLAELAGHEITSYWLRHALYSALGPLRHHLGARQAHPEDLYQDLIRFAGALCTFSPDADVDEIPRYDHADPTNVFGSLERQIRKNLNVVIREGFLSLPLPKTDSHLHASPIHDPRMLGKATWVLRVKSSAPPSTIITDVTRKVKICSAEDVMRLVRDANPGLTVTHLPAPPSSIAPRVGSHYFEVSRRGKSWEIVKYYSSVGVYVPDSLPDADLELLVVPE